MERYIDYIKEKARKDISYSMPSPMDMKAMREVLSGLYNEMEYVGYKYILHGGFDLDEELKGVKSIYLFNPVILHAYGWDTGDMTIFSIKERCESRRFEPQFQNIELMKDFAFYDDMPVAEVLKKMGSNKNKPKGWKKKILGLFRRFGFLWDNKGT